MASLRVITREKINKNQKVRQSHKFESLKLWLSRRANKFEGHRVSRATRDTSQTIKKKIPSLSLMDVKWLCRGCGWKPEGKKKWCRRCPNMMMSYECPRSKQEGKPLTALHALGLYTNFYRHKKACLACSPQQARVLREAKGAKKRKREVLLATQNQGKSHLEVNLFVEQPPASEWDAKRVNRETGLTLQQLEYVETLCHQELVNVPALSNRVPQLSPRNMLLLTLKWLRRYPATEDLAQDFKVSRSGVVGYIQRVLNILDSNLQNLRNWPRRYRSKITSGDLIGAVGAVDTFPICIPQPKLYDDRKRYYVFKPGHKTRYGWKVQTFVDLHGRILDVTDAHPFGSKADITLFRESCVPEKLNPNARAMAPAPRKLAARLETRIRNANIESEDELAVEVKQENKYANFEPEEPGEAEAGAEEEEENGEEEADLVPNISNALSEAKALGDKAYLGSELIYVPHKKFKGKRFTKAKKEFNKELSSKRVIVENVNKRLEDFRVIGTIYRGARNSQVVSRIVRVIVSLQNLTLESHPLRKQRHRRKTGAND